jgi:hypothetical protein
VQPGRQIVALQQGLFEQRDPGLGEHAAAVGDPDDKGPGPGFESLVEGHVGEAEIGLAAVEAQLADTPVRTPVCNALRGLRRELVRRVAEKQKIRMLDRHTPLEILICRCLGLRDAPGTGPAIGREPLAG